MEILSSRVLLRPRDFDRSLRFYRDTLGLAIFREWGSGSSRGVVFFLGGGFLELSRRAPESATGAVELWLQVRDLDATHEMLRAEGVPVIEPPADKPWGLKEMRIQDPDGLILFLVEVPETHPLRRRID